MARQATARFTHGLSGWMRSALPGVVIDAPDEERGRRDRVVDAAMYVFAFAIGAATLVDTWELHPPWLRAVAIVVGIARSSRCTGGGPIRPPSGSASGRSRLVIITASGANLVAAFNAAIRARGRDLAVIAGLTRRVVLHATRCSIPDPTGRWAQLLGSTSGPAC